MSKLVGFLVLFFIVLSIVLLLDYGKDPMVVNTSKYDVVSVIGCQTDSMGLVMGCNDTLYLKKLNEEDVLVPGTIYVYNATKSQTVHRLVECIKIEESTIINDKHCNNTLIFRGDNNAKGELVSRKDVLYRVESIVYAVRYIPSESIR